MFLLGFSSVPRWGLACPWVSGSAARFALGLKNFSTPLNYDNRAYSIQCLLAKRGRNTLMGKGTGQSSFGEFSCFKLGSRSGHNRPPRGYQSLTRSAALTSPAVTRWAGPSPASLLRLFVGASTNASQGIS